MHIFRLMFLPLLLWSFLRTPPVRVVIVRLATHFTAYVTEIFECGHSEDFHFLDDAEPLTARRRL
jgi:hypothetical protein